MKITSSEQADREALNEAAADAYEWLEGAKPHTLEAIIFWVTKDRLSAKEIRQKIAKIYMGTEEKARAKMNIVAEAMVRDRDQ